MAKPLPRPLSFHAVSTRRASALMLTGLLAANLLAWAWALTAFAGQPTLLATALLAYLFGLRHAVDPDHIAAIDNVVRKLMQDGQRPLAVGFFFSIGHSTLILLAVAVIVSTTAALQSRFGAFRELGGVVSIGVSAFFLLAIAVTNLVILKGVWRSFQRVKRGEAVSEEEMDMLLAGHGFLARLFRPLFRLVTRSWHMFPIGFLFGLGFDTATEIGLFSVSASHASHGSSLWSVMVFPVLFTVGMALVDTLDSMLMVGAYGWAFVNPVRKIWYNLTITTVSVLVAFGIGGLEALGLLANQLQLTGAFWDVVATMNQSLANFGYLVIGVFLASWAISAAIYKWRGYDLRYGNIRNSQ
ncbi:HoxN/HupN/NixA family nickel/cobalt transporter [Vogesella sp. LIG4]|uniref:HoxN/HupN/NixA family nickel/cobalt transporter n=1 Tax=Vogesella sp. LIG4 TaxID=1192162 RepID=UPI00081F85D3|nr:HoxN/HupN/NixA family nickel/cobalt transporter [Vogesella sp. LIG4]SCK26764.1 high-affinity nickel-transport protein [Vogesella sp. LIG4]